MSAGKLATIVVIDVSGFSARAQTDERAAVASVARLIKRCARVAKAHSGRIFNTAGDAVMMEFSSVSGGLEAADELARNPDPPIRVGVHLGEVRQMPNGDLLGHGVNVATRLQALASPGGVVVSEDARRALRGPLSERLISPRSAKLDKIAEDIVIYDLSRDAEAAARAQIAERAMRAARRTAVVSMAALGAALLAALAWPLLQPPSAPRVAVFSLAAPAGDQALQTAADGVADDVALTLTAIGVHSVARAETTDGTRERRLNRARDLGAALALDGVAERDGAGVRFNVAVIRTTDRTVLWSHAFEGTPTDIAALRQRAAEQSADALSCGALAMRGRRRELDTETLSLLLSGCAAKRDNMLEVRDTMAQIVARDPHIPYARAMLALSSVMAADDAPEPTRAALLQSARSEAERAVRADPNIGESYVALSLLERESNFDARERLLRRGLERDERNATLNNNFAALLHEVGRLSEALAYAQRGVALDPLSRSKRRHVALLLAQTGRHEDARELIEGLAPISPEDPMLWQARMRVALWGARYDDALALLADRASSARSSAAQDCWRDAIAAMSHTSAPTAQRLLACRSAGHLPDDQVVMALVAIDDLDDAFALVGEPSAPVDELFAPTTARMRADPRFMPLMRDRGLLRYWRLSGRWPDFCRDTTLPYRCEVEAARLT